MSTVSPASRHDLTDAQWAVLVPLLPPPTGRGRPRQYPLLAGAGVWERIESALIGAADAQGKLSWQASVDSTTARAHVHAAGARRDSVNLVAGEPDHPALGRSRGGWSTTLTRPSTSAAA